MPDNRHPLKQLLNKFLKVSYDDYGKLNIFKGELIGYCDDFLTLKGDYNSKTIARRCVVTITEQKRPGDAA